MEFRSQRPSSFAGCAWRRASPISLKKADNHWAEIKSGKVTYRIVGMPDRDEAHAVDRDRLLVLLRNTCS